MSSGNRGPGSPSRRPWAFLPIHESLEARQLLTTIDLATTQSAPLGVQMVGQNNTGASTQVTGAGYTVTDVGDLTGSGYDDYVVGAPGLTSPTLSSSVDPTFTGTSTAYLIFGSSAVNLSTVVDYAQLPTVQRGGDLGQLGGTGTTPPGYQLNPTLTQPTGNLPPTVGFNYNGLTLTTGKTPASGLGFSVAALGDINGDGHDDFAIGAPNDTGGGQVYIIYGGTALGALSTGTTQASKILDLEPTTGTSGLVNAGVKVINVTDSAALTGARFGYSVAGIGNFLNYGPGTKDVGIGAPGLTTTVNGVTAATGAAFALSGAYLNTLPSETIDIKNDFTTAGTNQYGIEYVGTGDGAEAGFSVSSGSDFDGYLTSAGYVVDDFLIGAPGGATSAGLVPGRAYLVYGHQFVATTNGISDATLGTIQLLSQIGTTPTANPLYTPLEGLIFNAPGGSFGMGWSVSTAGDYNGDGLGDVIIGAPFVQGSATIFYGQPSFTPAVTSPATPPHIVGTYVNASQTYEGIALNDYTGYSVSYFDDLTGEGINGVIIGAPGTNSGFGEAYVIPGNYLTPTSAYNQVLLSTAITSPAFAGFGLTTSNSLVTGSATNPPALGTSVSGRSVLTNTQLNTIDQDAIPDVFVGAPGFNLNNPASLGTVSRVGAGETFALEGTFLPRTPPNDVILTQAGIGTNTPTGPYNIATSPNNLTIYLYSAPAANGNPAFTPATDPTSPTTLTINGVSFPNETLTPITDSNGDGVQDASFVIDRSKLNLVSGSTISFIIQGKTNAGTVFVAKAAVVNVNGGSGGGGAGGGGGISGPSAATILASPIFTGNFAGLPYPPVSTLSTLISYQPLPVNIAYNQYLPAPGFLARDQVYHHPGKGSSHQAPVGTIEQVSAIRRSINVYAAKNTLGHEVFTKSKFTYGKKVTFTHKVKVIPAIEQTQTFQY